MRFNWLAYVADLAVACAISSEFISLSVNRPVPQALLPELVAALVCLCVFLDSIASSVIMVIVFLTTAALAATWMAWFGAGAAVFGLVGWTLFVVRRVRSVQDVPDDDVQVGRLVWDVSAAVVTALISTSGGVALSGMQHLSLILFAGGAALRLGGLRSAQIARAKRKGVADVPSILKSFGVMAGILLCGLVALYVFPGFRLWLLVGIVIGILLYRLWSDRRFAIGMLVLAAALFLLILFIQSVAKRHQIAHSLQGQTAGPPKLPKIPPHVAASHHIPDSVWVILAVIALGVGFLIIRNLRKERKLKPVEPTSPVVERTRMQTPADHRYRDGGGIAGLLVRWLEWEEGVGQRIRRGETARAFWARLRTAGSTSAANADEELSRLVTLYEAHRYGGQTVADDQVSDLQESLRNRGVFQKTHKKRRV